jgi:hypothetical protein
MGIAFGTAVAVGLFSPVIYALAKVARMKKAYRAGWAEPIRELPLRPAGESLRLKVEHLSEAQQEFLFIHIFAGLAMLLVINAVTGPVRLWVIAACAFVVLIDFFTGVPKILRITGDLWNARLGYIGECVVAEELNQLMYSGYRVFHDLPFASYNIDHVVVGPGGVFVVETKTRRKPKEEGKTAEYKVTYDGECLRWPTARETQSVDQAAFNARSLSHELSSATAECVPVQPIIAIPGWWVVSQTKAPAVWVLNPKSISSFVLARDRALLSPAQIQRIAHQLTQKCRLSKDNA